ncbi:MAG: hypothetical protein ACR2P8_01835 [Myxococcota bacterium]
MKIVQMLLISAAAIALLVVGFWLYTEQIANPRVVRELVEKPDGERAQRVMLLTLPSGRRIPVNYLREDDRVYAGADGTWWQELVGDGVPVTLLVRGETLAGTARAVRDDPTYTKRVFARLRPNAVEGFGTLIEIHLEAGEPAAPRS